MTRRIRSWRARRALWLATNWARDAERIFTSDPCLRTALAHQRALQDVNRKTVALWETRA